MLFWTIVLHWKTLCIASTCSTTLDSKGRPHGRLSNVCQHLQTAQSCDRLGRDVLSDKAALPFIRTRCTLRTLRTLKIHLRTLSPLRTSFIFQFLGTPFLSRTSWSLGNLQPNVQPRVLPAFCPRNAPKACDSPTVVVDFPSPKGVGLIPQTTT